MSAISQLALRLVAPVFALDPKSDIHGRPHWARVSRNGKTLCRVTGANVDIVEWFAYLHDSHRKNDGHDPLHGVRAARFAWALWDAGHIKLSEQDFFHLQYALATHSDGFTTAPIAVGVCWDADRLDLPRCGVTPDPKRMSTWAGRAAALGLR